MRKVLSFVFAITIVFSIFAGVQITSSATDLQSEGQCGENAYYTFDLTTRTVTISGTGKLFDWSNSPFYDQKKIRTIIINDGITDISNCTFQNCSSLVSISLPKSLVTIGYSGFAYCENLKEINIPENITVIEDDTFYYCTSLQKVTFNGHIKSIGKSAFSNCNLSAVHFPESLINIGDNAFEFNHFEEVYIPESVTEIGYRAFYHSVYQNAFIPNSVIYIGDEAFKITIGNTFFNQYFKIFCTHNSEAEKYAIDNRIKYFDYNHIHQYKKYFGIEFDYIHTYISCEICNYVIDESIKVVGCYPKSIKLSSNSFYSTGSQIKPAIKVFDCDSKVISSKYYTVSYSNNINVGTAKVKVTFKDVYAQCKPLTATFKIIAKKITSCYMDNYTYNGKAIVPVPYYYKTVIKTDSNGNQYKQKVRTYFKNGTDYTISVSGKHKDVGKYTATIKFKGNYTGTVKKTFQILPVPVTKTKTLSYSTTSIKVTWNKVAGISGYSVYRYNYQKSKWQFYKKTISTSMIVPRVSAKDTDVSIRIHTYKKVGKAIYYNIGSKTKYDWDYTKPSKPIVKLQNIDFGEFNIIFNRSTGHQIQISDNKAFSNQGNNYCKTLRYYSDSVHCYDWASNKTFYIRAREYYYSKNEKLIVSSWSDVKSIKTY